MYNISLKVTMMLFILFILITTNIIGDCDQKVYKRTLQKAHERPQWMKWSDTFLGKTMVDQQTYLVKLLKRITSDYLTDCTPVILYDNFTELYDNLLLEKLLTNFPFAYIHGQITDKYEIKVKATLSKTRSRMCYMLFMKDVMKSRDVIGEQSYNKVIVVARSSQWRVIEFLAHKESQSFVNLLVIVKSGRIISKQEESPYILYTHMLYIDALGASKPEVVTTWLKGKFTRDVNLFPKKIDHGFSGHRFLVSVAHQPPFVINKGRNDNGDIIYDGIEVRLIELLSQKFNFTTDYRETIDALTLGSGEAVTQSVEKRKVNLGLGGLYLTDLRINKIGLSQWHSQDCAAFISLSSTALPRYRAILGPFHWSVWIALTAIYLFAIFPLTFSDKLTLKPLLTNPEEMENMFWYVFGTFTNCFTFIGKNSWSQSEKVTTRVLIGFYWLFTIILTASYTGSIIAFVTLPVYPDVVDTIKQLHDGRYRIGTLDKGGWPNLFENASDIYSKKLFKRMDLVPDVESGLKNTTNSFFWNYAFLGSKSQLDYIVRTNFTTKSKRSILHITKECVAPFYIGIGYPKNSIYSEILDAGILLILQTGIMNKLKGDVEWDMMRSATGKLLSASTKTSGIKALTYEDRALTLVDTQGMFLLLAAGFAIGTATVISEWLGGCFKCCKGKKRRSSDSSIESNPRSHERQTPREILSSIHYLRCRLSSGVQFKQGLEREFDNSVHCEIHEVESIDNNTQNNEDIDSDEDFNEEVNKIFEKIFGEENVASENSSEEITEDVNLTSAKEDVYQ